MANLLKKSKEDFRGLRVKEQKLPAQTGVLGTFLDAMTLPEGHACCPKCSKYKFEVSGYFGKLEMGCMECGERFYVHFPVDVDLPQGRYICKRHPKKGMILIHNVDVVCVGCESCKTEMQICLRKAKGIVLVQ